jgi:hypothetical protein
LSKSGDRATQYEESEKLHYLILPKSGDITLQYSGEEIPEEKFHAAEPFSRSRQLCSYSKISQNFMKLVGSLPC